MSVECVFRLVFGHDGALVREKGEKGKNGGATKTEDWLTNVMQCGTEVLFVCLPVEESTARLEEVK